MPFTSHFHSWAGAYTVGGVSPGDLNRSLSCLSLISTSLPHALRSVLTPESPGYIPVPALTTCCRPQFPLCVSVVGRAADGLGLPVRGVHIQTAT